LTKNVSLRPDPAAGRPVAAMSKRKKNISAAAPDPAAASAKTAPPSVLPRPVARALVELCDNAIWLSENADPVRASVAKMTLALRRIARDAHGCDSADVVALSKILRETDPRRDVKANGRPRLRTDVVPRLRLPLALAAAAEEIRAVWTYFERTYAPISVVRYEAAPKPPRRFSFGPREARDEPPPQWFDRYAEWSLSLAYEPLRNGATALSIALDVLIGNAEPFELDLRHGLEKGEAMKTFQAALRAYVRLMPRAPKIQREIRAVEIQPLEDAAD
jgi:hypothetical protein